jgi:hypothetical protein
MSDAIETTDTTDPVEAETPDVIEGQESLGDPGKRALDAMKAQRKAAQDEARAYKAELDALKAQAEGREAEHAAEIERQKIKDEALSAANTRILKSELKAAATGKLADPTDAALFIDLSQIAVSEDGDVDSEALDAAISELLTRKPHLAAKQGRFTGPADQGGVRQDAKPRQLSEADIAGWSPAQINQARREGLLNDYMGINH